MLTCAAVPKMYTILNFDVMIGSALLVSGSHKRGDDQEQRSAGLKSTGIRSLSINVTEACGLSR